MNNIILGIDIGGSHITAALVSLEAQEVLQGSRIREMVDSRGKVDAIVSKWCSVIKRSFKTYNFEAGKIGIAMPGPFDYGLGISKIKGQNKYDALYGLNIKKLLAEKLSIRTDDIQFINDAECFLHGEAFCGAANGFNRALGLTLGTGFGTAWYRDGIAEDAALWNQPFKDGIAEDYLGSNWFLIRFKEFSGIQLKSVKRLADLAKLSPVARNVFNEFGENLAEFLGPFIQREKPESLVIGGSIAKAYDLFYPSLDKGLKKQSISISIFLTKLGEEAAIIGAASCWNGRLTRKSS